MSDGIKFDFGVTIPNTTISSFVGNILGSFSQQETPVVKEQPKPQTKSQTKTQSQQQTPTQQQNDRNVKLQISDFFEMIGVPKQSVKILAEKDFETMTFDMVKIFFGGYIETVPRRDATISFMLCSFEKILGVSKYDCVIKFIIETLEYYIGYFGDSKSATAPSIDPSSSSDIPSSSTDSSSSVPSSSDIPSSSSSSNDQKMFEQTVIEVLKTIKEGCQNKNDTENLNAVFGMFENLMIGVMSQETQKNESSGITLSESDTEDHDLDLLVEQIKEKY
jgi:hypothetical protein